MKKKLEAELISIAHRILQLKDRSTLPQLQEEARQLYEKLTILSFSEAHFSGPQPTIGQVKAALNQDESEEIKLKERIAAIVTPKPVPVVEEKPVPKIEERIEPTINEEKVEEPSSIENKHELVIEEINARVTEDLFVPASTTVEESSSFSEAEPFYEQKDKEDEDDEDKPKSLNDQLRKDIHIGLNDRLAFIKYLFEGSAPDYNRVLSQLGTMRNKYEAEDFINTMVKPDYNHWESKEEYAERFMDVILSKFEH